MVSTYTRNMIWTRLHDAGRLSIYYSSLSNRYLRWHRFIRLALLLSVMGSISDVIKLLPTNANLYFAALAGVLMAIDFVFDNGRKSALTHVISVECGNLQTSWEDLWVAINYRKMEEEEAERRHNELNGRLGVATSAAGHANVIESPRLNRKSAREAYAVIGDQYAGKT